MQTEEYLQKVYAGFLGMNIGIRLGAPVEPREWTYERIRDVYGNIKGYIKDYSVFSADDDANGPVFFIRALLDDAINRELEPQDVGRAWLNYCREGIGMLWWGGEAYSTEHRAYSNLTKGIDAPRSGSAEENGIVLAEQIGGQIFIDTWGLIFPGNPGKAADYAEKAASVSHDRNGLHGARFMAACIAQAFSAGSIDEILSAGLLEIPPDSEYARLVRSILSFHHKNPDDFRLGYHYVEETWGYHKYPGECHIIPNAGVCVLSLLYGKGRLDRTVEIAVMCGWDTDCNAGNVGTICGVFSGLQNIPLHYRTPINDTIVTSSVAGYLNILDIPTFVKELALLKFQVERKEPPEWLESSLKNGEVYLDFALPGSTHGFRTNHPFKTILRPAKEKGFRKPGSLEVLFDRFTAGDSSRVFWKPFYRRAEFNDEKYKPVFSPKAYSGQTVSAKIFLDQWRGEKMLFTPYVRDTWSKEILELETVELDNQSWNSVEFQIPDTNGSLIDEIGYRISSHSPSYNRAFGKLFIDDFRIYGKADYTIDFSKQSEEFQSVTPFAHHKGKWRLDGNRLHYETMENCSSYSGNYYASNYNVSAYIEPKEGGSHLLLFRAKGIKRHYLAGFDGEGYVSFIRNDFGYQKLKTVPFSWELGKEYHVKIECRDSRFIFLIDDEKVMEIEDDRFPYGMYGAGCLEKGAGCIRGFRFQQL
ncbi:ADP-ribosylglycohydrolase family protein [Bacillus sp. FJAT-42376]|uniref:ADP-ribosylglycohydrolase family protein n=1 Tax=Bacillus sp. FJAT-42376 TaxID=2014076 RepID=UPI000F4D3E86|nr:ADP-ribosylglycohydrolase family protein [Bacillus sp. FJAT-42376]AZB44517.1 ADP-ribosylglycohydrolase family protein [Bacillus sp. FJAT-42376]